MPSRLITGAILIFWLGMTGWLIYREVVPMMRAGLSPTYLIDLTDEIGAPMVGWKITLNGKRIGSGTTQIHVSDDRAYKFHSTMRFDHFAIGPVQIRHMDSVYRVTEDGKLQSLRAKVIINPGSQNQFLVMPDMAIGLQADVIDDYIEARVFVNETEHKLDKVKLPQQGSIINPMHPVSRLRGLRNGQIWKIALLDPLRAVQNPLVGDFGKQGMAIPFLIAEVKTDTLHWNRKDVPCYKIEYYEPGKESEVTARTWARMSDGLVLQQEATHFGFELISQRVPG